MDETRLPKKRYITKADFARLLGVNASQITRALSSGRIVQTKSGMIDWREALTRWDVTRRDSLKGTGRANNSDGVRFEPLPDVPDVSGVEDIDGDLDDDPYRPPTRLPKGKKPEALSNAILRETIAKADRQEMRAMKEKGELFERADILRVYGEILNKLKDSVLAFPQRSMLDIVRIIKQWLAEQDVKVDASQFAPLETLVINSISKESRIVLTSVTDYIEDAQGGLDSLVKKK